AGRSDLEIMGIRAYSACYCNCACSNREWYQPDFLGNHLGSSRSRNHYGGFIRLAIDMSADGLADWPKLTDVVHYDVGTDLFYLRPSIRALSGNTWRLFRRPERDI